MYFFNIIINYKSKAIFFIGFINKAKKLVNLGKILIFTQYVINF